MKKINSFNNFKSSDLSAHRGLNREWVIKGYLFSLKRILSMVIILGLITTAAILVFNKKQPIDPNVAVASETDDLAARIGKFMELPIAEQPTLVTVTDKAKLRDQDFFQHAQDGDKVLVYSKAKKVILYRPSTGKIIDVTNLTPSDESSSS